MLVAQAKVFSLVPLDHRSDRIISHLFAYVSCANGLVLSHLAVFSHYRPLVSLSFSSLLLKVRFTVAVSSARD